MAFMTLMRSFQQMYTTATSPHPRPLRTSPDTSDAPGTHTASGTHAEPHVDSPLLSGVAVLPTSMKMQVVVRRMYDVVFFALISTIALCYAFAWWDWVRPQTEACQQRPRIVTFPPFVSDTIDVGISSGLGIMGITIISVMFIPIWSTRCEFNRRLLASLRLGFPDDAVAVAVADAVQRGLGRVLQHKRWSRAMTCNEWIGCATFLANFGVVAFRLNVDVALHLVFAVFHFAGLALILGFQHLFDEMLYTHAHTHAHCSLTESVGAKQATLRLLPSVADGRMPLRRNLFRASCACLAGLVAVGTWILVCPVDASVPHGTLMLNANLSPILKQLLAWFEISVFVLFNWQWYMWRYAFRSHASCGIEICLKDNTHMS